MFEKASRLKLRFEYMNGVQLTAEQLWDLPLESNSNKANLYDIARELHACVKSDEDLPFLSSEKKEDAIIKLKFDIVKYIIETRRDEMSKAIKAKENAETKKKILSIIAEQDEASLRSKSKEDLLKLYENL